MFVLAYLSINTIMVAVIAVAVRDAPLGYEDEFGVHFGPLPGR